MKKATKHLTHYLPLVGMFTLAIVGFLLFPYDTAFQLAITLAVGAAYVSWGVVHHLIHRDLTLSVFIEYIAVATVGVVMIVSLLLNK